jgi:hypothetical protein
VGKSKDEAREEGSNSPVLYSKKRSTTSKPKPKPNERWDVGLKKQMVNAHYAGSHKTSGEGRRE